MTLEDDKEINQISHLATEQANELYPERPFSIRVKIGLLVAAIVLSLNAGLGLFNTYQVERTLQCQHRLQVSSTQIASDDRVAVDQFINGTTKIKDQNTFNQLLANYNAARKANDSRRAALLATNCN